MNLLRALPLMIACIIASPVNAETSNSKELYTPPESISKELVVSSNTKNTVTFKFSVKSLIGKAKNVSFYTKVLGNDGIKPVPNTAKFEEISEGKDASLVFVLPVSLKQIQDRSVKVQADVEYLPDYDAIIKNIEANSNTAYQNPSMKDQLVDKLKKDKEKELKSRQSTRYIPENKN